MGGKLPPDDLIIDDWLGITEPADIYVLGYDFTISSLLQFCYLFLFYFLSVAEIELPSVHYIVVFSRACVSKL